MELWTDSDVLEGGVGGRVGEEEIREDEGVDGEDLEARGGREEVGREGGAVEKRRSSRFVYFGEEDVLKRGSEIVEEILEERRGRCRRRDVVLRRRERRTRG